MNYQATRQRYIESVDEALSCYLKRQDIPALLQKSMAYSIFAGGKRLRPCLALAVCEMLKGDAEAALPFACAIEMIHTYSLIHDDLPAMDNDDLRRGKPTNHKVFGEGQAILAGDGLLSYAAEILLEETASGKDPGFAQAALAIAKGAGVGGMVAGQCLDLENEGGKRVDETLLLAIHRGKTAALIRASVEAGAYCAHADKGALENLQAFAEQYGMLFQITDDILDVTGEGALLGKTTGKDANAGKLSFPAVYGLEGAQQYAARAAQKAQRALLPFGEKAGYLNTLVGDTVSRKA